jgi:hypothetical protein
MLVQAGPVFVEAELPLLELDELLPELDVVLPVSSEEQATRVPSMRETTAKVRRMDMAGRLANEGSHREFAAQDRLTPSADMWKHDRMKRWMAFGLLGFVGTACEPAAPAPTPKAAAAAGTSVTDAKAAKTPGAAPVTSAAPSAAPVTSAAPSAAPAPSQSAAASASTATALPEPPTAAGAEAFFKNQIQACNAWNVKVGNNKPGEKLFAGDAKDPTTSIKVGKLVRPKVWEIQDRDGTRLLVDMELRRITSARGPNSEMPAPYRFCDEKVFVGTSD